VVRAVVKAPIQPTWLSVRAGLDGALRAHRDRWLAHWEREAAMPMKLWWAQLALNFSWSPAFFAAHRIGIALLIVLLLLGTIGAFIALSWRQDRLTAWLFVPYAAWVAFASVLNAAIYWLNSA
jgi:translocator protein